MPWTIDDPPSPAKNWDSQAKRKCVIAANAALSAGSTEQNAIFACIRAVGKSENMAKETDDRGYTDLFDLKDVEIFRTGVWNGDRYNVADLDDMVGNFGKVGFTPPIKLGHAEASGAPAHGWIRALRRIGDKLVADFHDLPKAVFKQIKRKQFGPVSSEIFWNLRRDGKVFKRVLKAVALLGAEIPAVSGLKPLHAAFVGDADSTHLYSLDREDLAMAKTEDKTIGVIQKDDDVLKLLQAENQGLKQKLSEMSREDSKEELKKLQDDLKARDERIAKIEEARRLESVDRTVETVRVPAYKEHIRVFLELATQAESEVKFSEGDKTVDIRPEKVVEKLIAKINKDTEYLFREFSKKSEDGPDLTDRHDVQAEVDKRVQAKMRKDQTDDYEKVLTQVLDDDEGLKKAYAST